MVVSTMNEISSKLSKIIKFHKEGKFLASKPLILEVLEKDKKNIELLKLLSFTELQIGNINDSIKIISKAIDLKDDVAEFYLIRGYSYMNNRDNKLALIDFKKAINIDSNLKDAYLNIGVIYSNLKDYDNSLKYFSKLIDIDPNDKRVYTNLAFVRSEMNDYEGALKEIDKSIEIDQNNLNAYLLRGNIYKQLKKFKLSLADFDKVVSQSKETANQKFYYEGLYNKSLLRLLEGEFDEGWKLYENRFFIDEHKQFENFKREKIYSKISVKNIPYIKEIKDFKNSDILIISEQGIGEHIIFLSLISEVSKLSKSTTVLIDSRLVSICERSFENITFLPLGDQNLTNELFNKKVSLLKKTNFDYQISAASLPNFFRKNISDFDKSPNCFFIVNKKIKDNIKKELKINNDKRIIGISWTSFNSALNYFKNVDLKQFGLIFKDLNISLVNLQYGDVDEEINNFINDTKIPIKNYKLFDIKNDFESLLSLIDLCDLIISTDNTTIRLSGSINKETWVMLPDVSQFFYLLERSDCLWFPSLKLYRQDKRADWTGMLSKIRNDLLKRYS